MGGALAGLRIVEFFGIGPGPFCATMLADHGAEVIRVMRPGGAGAVLLDPHDPHDALGRSRQVVTIDLKSAEGLAVTRDLCRAADGIVEGYRPGVMERLGLGPDVLLGDHPGLVYGRVTGWGQDGPLAQAAGHDINYIAINGVLHTIGRHGERPVPPVNYLADFGGGGMLLAFGMVAALLARARGGPGQVVDAAMVDGSALLSAMVWSMKGAGTWHDEAGRNWLDGAAHFYDTYQCADGRFVAIGAIEPRFYALLREALGVADDPAFDAQMEPAHWPALKARMAAILRTRPRDEWIARVAGTDVCLAPVLSLDEARRHPHNVARQTFVEVAGEMQPAPAPRLSRTPAVPPRAGHAPGLDAAAILAGIGYDPGRIAALRRSGVVE